MNEPEIPTRERLSQDKLIQIYITERIVSALEKITNDVKDMLTNPLGLGTYLKKLAEKDDPVSYIPSLMIVAGLIYFVAAKYGNEITGRITIIITFFLVTLIVVFRFMENNRRKRK